MSTKLKQKLEQLTLILFFCAGAILLGSQIRKYILGMELTIEELIVTVVAISLVINPRFLLNGFSKIIDSKFNKKSNDNNGEANVE